MSFKYQTGKPDLSRHASFLTLSKGGEDELGSTKQRHTTSLVSLVTGSDLACLTKKACLGSSAEPVTQSRSLSFLALFCRLSLEVPNGGPCHLHNLLESITPYLPE